MIHTNEIVVFLLATGVLIYILAIWKRLRRVPAVGLLLASFFLYYAGWIVTIAEGFFWPDLLNLLEHACYAAAAVSLAVWCRRVFWRQAAGD